MLVGPNGRPIQAADGPTGRKIYFEERMVKGRPTWGFNPGAVDDPDEFVQILADAISAVQRDRRSRRVEQKVNQEVQGHINKLAKEMK